MLTCIIDLCMDVIGVAVLLVWWLLEAIEFVSELYLLLLAAVCA